VSRSILLLILSISVVSAKSPKIFSKPTEPTPLDRYISEAMRGATTPEGVPASGSLWSSSARFSDLGADLRAAHVNDLVTILVTERASAVTKGTTKTARSSSTKNSVGALAGITRATGPWSNLAKVSGDTQLDGQGTTSRETVLSTTLSARVTHVLPNGYLVVAGSKAVTINSENQIVTVRGVVRPADLSTGNAVSSDQIAQLEVQVSGKGVVGDAIRRPFFLYRLLLGLLPF
jgi:flagellar L-ring protein precursor FlgH